MKNITLNVYNDDKKTVKKVLIANEYDLEFGTIRKLMKLLKIENAANTFDIIKTLDEVWEEITAVLNTVFPEATDEDWNAVKVKELLPVVVQIVKYSLSLALSIPTEKN